MLWEKHGQEETILMRCFSALSDPYKPGHRHSEAAKAAATGQITQEHLTNISIAPSTASEAFIRVKKPKP
jgi:hypothetical protein